MFQAGILLLRDQTLNNIFSADGAVSLLSFFLLEADHFCQADGMKDVVLRALRMRHFARSFEFAQTDWAILLLVQFERF